jgi:hypothetical protein
MVVLAFVAFRASQLWRQDTLEELHVNPGWLVLAGLVYGLGWLPSVWFWRRLLLSSGGKVRAVDAARSYYCGHLGKYVPGKAMVLIIRSALLKDRGVSAGTAAVMTGCETAVMMGVGAVIAVAHSLPALATRHFPDAKWLSALGEVPGASIAAAVAALVLVSPVVAYLLNRLAASLARRAARASQAPAAGNGPSVVHVGTGPVAVGLVLFTVAWMLHGLSLGLTLRSIDAAAFRLSDFPDWTAAVAGATVAGFVAVFAPGGMGVREGLLIETLRLDPAIGERHAVSAAILLRVVWLAAEIALAGVLYYLVRLRVAPEVGERGAGS